MRLNVLGCPRLRAGSEACRCVAVDVLLDVLLDVLPSVSLVLPDLFGRVAFCFPIEPNRPDSLQYRFQWPVCLVPSK